MPGHPRGGEGDRVEETEWHKCPTQCKKKREEHCNPFGKGEGRKFRIAGENEESKNRFNDFP